MLLVYLGDGGRSGRVAENHAGLAALVARNNLPGKRDQTHCLPDAAKKVRRVTDVLTVFYCNYLLSIGRRVQYYVQVA